MKFILSLLFPSVDSITASLKNTVVNLRAVQAKKLESAKRTRVLIEELESDALDADIEAIRASNVAGRIEALLV